MCFIFNKITKLFNSQKNFFHCALLEIDNLGKLKNSRIKDQEDWSKDRKGLGRGNDIPVDALDRGMESVKGQEAPYTGEKPTIVAIDLVTAKDIIVGNINDLNLIIY